MSEARANPFTMRSALLLVAGGAALFVALLWMVGAGLVGGSVNDGGGHAGGKGLNGYAGFARLIEAQGRKVSLARSPGSLKQPGILVLTPQHWSDGSELERIYQDHRWSGPTMIVLPKWQAMALPAALRPQGAKEGWVVLGEADTPRWSGFLDEVGVSVAAMRQGNLWQAQGFSGALPVPDKMLSGSGERLVPLVEAADGSILAAYLGDGGSYPGLAARALEPPEQGVKGQSGGPLVLVFEPDLINNYGLAREQNARLAMALVSAMDESGQMPVIFDLTLNGHARASNLLTLAFTPPFLAATLCLLLAAVVIGWRAFLRFGPPRRTERAIAFGKRALVSNSAGFLRRTRRLHLVSAPYAERARQSLTRALGLARQPSRDEAEQAIDRALAARDPEATPFSRIAGRLRGAGSPVQAVTAARELHALERKLKR
jgi:hypothetical protein